MRSHPTPSGRANGATGASPAVTFPIRAKGARLLAASLFGVGLSVIANQARAQNLYFDVNGATAGYGIVSGSTYNWDDPNWATASGGATATGNWVQGDFPRFPGGVSGNAYTVTLGSDEQTVGMYETVNGVSLTLNATGAGSLDILPGTGGAAQGILNGGSLSTLTINAPITGIGGITPSNGGTINLFGTNTYSGGTNLTSTATLTYFNSSSSFGTGTISLAVAANGVAPLLGSGGTTVTIPNNIVNTVSGAGFNFAANASTPVVVSGTVGMGANNLYVKENGNATSPLSLTNTISGTANLTLGGANGGTTSLSGANTYTGTTIVGLTGATTFTLKLAAANTIASTSSLVLAGGTVNPGGFIQNMSASTLGLTANSTIDFGATTSEMDFANSSLLTWNGTLNLLNFTQGDVLRFGTNGSGLTQAQLNSISFNGSGTGTATLDANGNLVNPGASATPEPSVFALLGAGMSVFGGVARARRRPRTVNAV